LNDNQLDDHESSSRNNDDHNQTEELIGSSMAVNSSNDDDIQPSFPFKDKFPPISGTTWETLVSIPTEPQESPTISPRSDMDLIQRNKEHFRRLKEVNMFI
jgi:hypothetical protein